MFANLVVVHAARQHVPLFPVIRHIPEAAERFFQDARRFPAAAYERQSLVWKGDKWRTLDPSERAVLHGMPPALVEAVATGHEQARAVALRNSAWGNGFHVPSLMVILLLLFQLSAGLRDAHPSHLACKEEGELASRVVGTPFDNRFVNAYPGLLSVEELVQDMRPLCEASGDRSGAAWTCRT